MIKSKSIKLVAFLIILSTRLSPAYGEVTRELFSCERTYYPALGKARNQIYRIPESGEIVYQGKVWRTLRLSFNSDLDAPVIHAYEGDLFLKIQRSS